MGALHKETNEVDHNNNLTPTWHVTTPLLEHMWSGNIARLIALVRSLPFVERQMRYVAHLLLGVALLALCVTISPAIASEDPGSLRQTILEQINEGKLDQAMIAAQRYGDRVKVESGEDSAPYADVLQMF